MSETVAALAALADPSVFAPCLVAGLVLVWVLARIWRGPGGEAQASLPPPRLPMYDVWWRV